MPCRKRQGIFFCFIIKKKAMFKKITIFLLLFFCFITRAQQVTTVTGFAGFADGTLATAQFSSPRGICADQTGTILYVADSGNNLIRKIDLNANFVSTIAGSTEGYADGIGTSAQFYRPVGVCLDSNGFLFVAEALNHKIRKIDLTTNTVTTFAGSTQGYANGTGTTAKFNNPTGICIDTNNNLYVSEYFGNKIRKITPTRQVTNYAGSGLATFADGIGTAASFYSPLALCSDAQNNIYVSDSFNSKIRKIEPNGMVTTITGIDGGYIDGTLSQAKFIIPDGICIDSNNNLYVNDLNNKIRKIDLNAGIVSTLLDLAPVNGDPRGICYINNTIYFTEFGGCKIKKITDFLATENFEQNIIKLYPNPNKGKFKINIDTNFKIEIYDILGQLVYNKVENQNETEIETALKKGIYFVKIINEESKIATQKMVVE
jgi:DNA-binding beta-propeller fold protein YncE